MELQSFVDSVLYSGVCVSREFTYVATSSSLVVVSNNSLIYAFSLISFMRELTPG